MAIRIAEYFEFQPEWYRHGAVAALVLEYYLLLRSVLGTKPHLRACLTRCRHCRIFFLTEPCNHGRRDLGCPFGCQQAHRQRQSTQRSAEYYRGKEGRKKKAIQNAKRKPATATSPPAEAGRWSEPMLGYVRRVVSLIEGRPVNRRQVVAMLEQVLRQHSLGRRRRIDHLIAWLTEHPP